MSAMEWPRSCARQPGQMGGPCQAHSSQESREETRARARHFCQCCSHPAAAGAWSEEVRRVAKQPPGWEKTAGGWKRRARTVKLGKNRSRLKINPSPLFTATGGFFQRSFFHQPGFCATRSVFSPTRKFFRSPQRLKPNPEVFVQLGTQEAHGEPGTSLPRAYCKAH